MRDLLLQAAGVLGMIVGVVHGMLGERVVFAREGSDRRRMRLLMRLGWQAGAVGWVGIGLLLAVAPTFGSDAARHWVVGVALAIYGAGAIGNAWATRGRHFGWAALAVVMGLAAAGA